jgi:N-succinyldiaminopimelate aminotransferase
LLRHLPLTPRHPDSVNPLLQRLQPYPFERLAKLHAGVTAPPGLRVINLSIGEPQHPTPPLILEALAKASSGFAKYPATRGEAQLREAICAWAARRHRIALQPDRQVLPINGSREGLFAITQVLVDPSERGALALIPNPFYQIYEGATLLAGATPFYLPLDPKHGHAIDWLAVPVTIWKRTRVVFVCSPNNPTGRVMPQAQWALLFDLSDRYGFTIVSDECYSEIYFAEDAPPLGALAAAHACGRDAFTRLIVLGSLSKRSNVPGLRSGFAAGDADIIQKFLLYRTYHGSAMGVPMQMASVAAWNDEAHVVENRRLYTQKFQHFHATMRPIAPINMPEAAFYFWLAVPGGDDESFARDLLATSGIIALPGRYLGRPQDGFTEAANPGAGYIRLALVASVDDADEAAQRLAAHWRLRAGAQAYNENREQEET